MDISFKLDPETIVGQDMVSRAGTICGRYGNRALIAAEKGWQESLYNSQNLERLKGILEDSGIESIVFDDIPLQATAAVVENAAGLCRGARCSMVIGFGGLKVQSIARMTATLGAAANGDSVYDLLDGQRPGLDPLPYIAIPATGGDPFLFSPYDVVVDPRDRSVKQIKSPDKLCVAAIIDSSLLESGAAPFHAAAIFDHFALALESYCSTRSNFLSDSLLEPAFALYGQMAGTVGFDVGLSAQAGVLSSLGSAISAPGIGTALSYALNGRFPVLKPWAGAVLLPHIMERLIAARPEKVAKAAILMGGIPPETTVADAANLALERIRRVMEERKVPSRLRQYNLSLDRLAPVAESARNLEFAAFSPWTISSEEAFEILKKAF